MAARPQAFKKVGHYNAIRNRSSYVVEKIMAAGSSKRRKPSPRKLEPHEVIAKLMARNATPHKEEA